MKTNSPLRDLRAAVLAGEVRDRGVIALDEQNYKSFAFRGWSRSEVQTAAEDCVRAGVCQLDTMGRTIVLRVLREQDGDQAALREAQAVLGAVYGREAA